MLQVSMGALISLVLIMLVCFVLPLPLFYLLYRADSKGKTFALGAASYIACGLLLDALLAAGVNMISDISSNGATYLLYAAALSPALFIGVNYLIIRRFGRSSMNTTGDSLMFSLGYSSVYNVLSTGFVSVMYFFTLLEIRGRNGLFTVVSDADYVSASEKVSSGDIVNQSVYNDMVKLCSQPVSYYVMFILNCLWVIAAYAAVLMVIWLAVKKTEKVILLAFAFVIRLFITLPDIFSRFEMIADPWVSQAVSFVILVIVWAAAVFCRRTFIDGEDAAAGEGEA